MKKFPPLLSYAQATALISACPSSAHSETIALNDAYGRVLATAVCLNKDQPHFDRCTMDGFAVVLHSNSTQTDTQRQFEIVDTIHAGESFAGTLISGQAIRIMTGAPAPAHSCVVPIECCDHTHGSDNVIIHDSFPLSTGKNIAQQGEDGHAGDIIAAVGCRLGSAVMSSCAMAGATTVEVFINPRIAIITTGDEVGGSGNASICDSNGPLLQAMCNALGCPSTRYHARDSEDGLRNCIEQAAAACDIVVSTGGVSAGNKDFVPATAQALGFEKIFHKVAIQPGKPILVCQHNDGRFFVGLPGNPVSVLATAHLFLAPIIGRFLSNANGGWAPQWLSLPLTNSISSKQRHFFLPARLVAGGIDPIQWNGSGDLLAAAAADGILNIPPNSTHHAGDCVPFLPYIGAQLGDRGTLPPRSNT